MLLIQVHILICTKKNLVLQLVAGWAIFWGKLTRLSRARRVRIQSPPTLWVQTPLRRGVLDTTLCDKVCQWLATGWWFPPVTPVSPPKKWPPRYNWNIVESDVKHHKPNPSSSRVQKQYFLNPSDDNVRQHVSIQWPDD